MARTRRSVSAPRPASAAPEVDEGRMQVVRDHLAGFMHSMVLAGFTEHELRIALGEFTTQQR